MENQKVETPQKKKINKTPDEIFRKINGPALKTLIALRDKANKKDYGKNVQDSDILAIALTLVTDEHIKALQEKSLSNKDRLSLNHEKYCKLNGKISLDEYLGILMQGESSCKGGPNA